MKLQFKHQKFQADAAKAVVDVFRGQPYLERSYLMDRGEEEQPSLAYDFTGHGNHVLVPELSDSQILEHVQRIQREGGLRPSEALEGRYNLTVEMETGVGKTYTYIKTMYELNKHYGWSKFIVVVPSVAIREGVFKTFQVTQEHFAEEYGKKIRFFIYSSKNLTEIDRFAGDSAMHVMIINAQAFNARGKDARRIYMELDEFRSRRPIDIIAKTNPIVVIDEPQSVEGRATKERLKEFNALFTLRYSATPRERYNLIYRLDALDAYNKKLVKKIRVKGITESGQAGTEGFVFLEGINVSQKSAPTATLRFDVKGKTGLREVSRKADIGFNLYAQSGGLEEYRDGFVVKSIDGRDDSVEFLNGIRLTVGEVTGKLGEEKLRRIQIRETILSHIEREAELFSKGIKVLSLFFIDEVKHYRDYDKSGAEQKGLFAQIFEEEYRDITSHLQMKLGGEAYMKYLAAIAPEATHAGYFSVDKKGHMTNGKISRRENASEDVDAYDLIMKNKELLLDRDPVRSPVRFIFSHSALREGWDNPNVFQICTLKESTSEVRKRQEVGRGMRLAVNGEGDRMDAAVLGKDVQEVNVLTVVASESYDSFARGLQAEIAESVADRPRAVTNELFINRTIKDTEGNETVIDADLAAAIYFGLIKADYIDYKGTLTEKYYADKANGTLKFAEKAKGFEAAVGEIIDGVYDARALAIEDARKDNVEPALDEEKLKSREFKELWQRINKKSVYVVDFDTKELVHRAVQALDARLRVPRIYFKVETGELKEIKSKESLLSGASFVKESETVSGYAEAAPGHVKYDLVGRLTSETGLTRRAVIDILTKIRGDTFAQFKYNPEEFIIKAAALINAEKATAIIEHITYSAINDSYGTEIFTKAQMRGKEGVNAVRTQKNLYDHLIYDSDGERKFAESLDTRTEVAVYVKLPGGFFISTPVGRYNPDWAIAFHEGNIKHIYFVAETKGSMETMELREIEKSKIHCAREHFKAISGDNVVYDVVDGFKALMDKVMK